MTDIKWIKLSVNMFDDEKIKLIRTMPEGDSIVIIWVQILCLAGKINDHGAVYMGQNLAYSDEMLATILGHPLNVMRVALQTLEQFEMIEVSDDGQIDVINWEKHQSTDKMGRIREQNRLRKRKYDLRQKIRRLGINPDDKIVPEDVEELENFVSTIEEKEGNVTPTLRNALEVRSKKLEVRSKKKEVNKEHSPAEAEPIIPYKEIVEYLNQKADRSFRHTTAKTKSLIKARYNEGFKQEDFEKVIDIKVEQWKNKADMEKYLRPETLFGTKFEGYLNEQYANSSKDRSWEEWDFLD